MHDAVTIAAEGVRHVICGRAERSVICSDRLLVGDIELVGAGALHVKQRHEHVVLGLWPQTENGGLGMQSRAGIAGPGAQGHNATRVWLAEASIALASFLQLRPACVPAQLGLGRGRVPQLGSRHARGRRGPHRGAAVERRGRRASACRGGLSCIKEVGEFVKRWHRVPGASGVCEGIRQKPGSSTRRWLRAQHRQTERSRQHHLWPHAQNCTRQRRALQALFARHLHYPRRHVDLLQFVAEQDVREGRLTGQRAERLVAAAVQGAVQIDSQAA
mmetsp:Transcript_29934/g.99171  ORF Transcript_29934/g.99171 Transcript_29934/m.99171 type:complete len:274 (-) Transcript_29934:2081-2902(-)